MERSKRIDVSKSLRFRMQSRGRNLPSVLPGEETFRALQSQRGALSSTAAEGEIEFEVSVAKKLFQIKIFSKPPLYIK